MGTQLKSALKFHTYMLQEEKSSNKTEEAKQEEKKPSKPVTVREPLETVMQLDDVTDTSEDAVSTSIKKYDGKVES